MNTSIHSIEDVTVDFIFESTFAKNRKLFSAVISVLDYLKLDFQEHISVGYIIFVVNDDYNYSTFPFADSDKELVNELIGILVEQCN